MKTYHYDIAHIVQKYCRNITMLAFTYTKNTADAEDIAQEAFVQLVKSKYDFESEEHLRAWLFRVTINKSKNHLKSFWIRNRGDFPKDTSFVSYFTKSSSQFLNHLCPYLRGYWLRKKWI